MKLDLGAGPVSPPGFIPIGRLHGSEIFPLPHGDETVDEIRASHVLEHFPHGKIEAVLTEWVRVLKKGGRLRVAVPDFAKIAESYQKGEAQPHEGWIMGGQTDPSDFHQSLFDRERLRQLLAAQRLVLIRPWVSELPEDGASLPISLNLEAHKPHRTELKVSGAMSVPRLGFMETMFCAIEAVVPCQVKMRKHGGAFWGQSLTKVFEKILAEDDPDLVLTLDYDSVFRPHHLATLIQVMMLHPEIDALAPIQSSRHLKTALFTVHGTEGENAPTIRLDRLEPETMPVATAHFGLTLLRAEKLRALAKPWFHSVPSPQGDWNGDHTDEDIAFWRKWEAQGFSLHLANRVAIGHLEAMIRWPGNDLQAFYQGVSDYHKTGVPDECWR